MKIRPGHLAAALTLLVGFTTILAVAASAEPLKSASSPATASTSAKKVLGRHYLGKITALNPTNKSFSLDLGSKKLVIQTSETTKFQTYSAGKKASTFDELKVGSTVAVVGELKGATVTAKLVFLLPTKTTKRHADRGIITAISGSSFSFNSTAVKNSTGTALVTSSTVFTKKVSGKIARVSFSDLTVGDKVSFTGTIDTGTGVISAKLVHVIPAATPAKTATSSAK